MNFDNKIFEALFSALEESRWKTIIEKDEQGKELSHELVRDDQGQRDDWQQRGILADFLEDCGDERAEAVRWMCEKQKRPYSALKPSRKKEEGESQGSDPGIGKKSDTWDKAAWFCEKKVREEATDPQSNIPEEIYRELVIVQGESGEIANHKYYPTWRAAEEAFYLAFQEAKKKGWKP